MPWGLKRFHESGQTQFVTSPVTVVAPCSLRYDEANLLVMPEHVHLLIGEPQRQTLAHDQVAEAKCNVTPYWRWRALLAKAYYDFKKA